MTSSRGGHGRTPSATDPRQGKARGDAYVRQAQVGLVGVFLTVVVVAAVVLVGVLLSQPGSRVWGWVLLAAVLVGLVGYRWWRSSRATSIRGTLSDLSE